MRQFILVVIVTLLLAGESFLLITTKSDYDHQQAQNISEELRANVLELSASLRNGEIEKYAEAKARYAEGLARFQKYAEGSNAYEKLKSYQIWLDSSETDKLLNFNHALKVYSDRNANIADIEAEIDSINELKNNLSYSKTVSDDLAKLLELAEKLRNCASYCFADDYAALNEEYRMLEEKISADWEKINNEYAARLQSEALIEVLENY